MRGGSYSVLVHFGGRLILGSFEFFGDHLKFLITENWVYKRSRFSGFSFDFSMKFPAKWSSESGLDGGAQWSRIALRRGSREKRIEKLKNFVH